MEAYQEEYVWTPFSLQVSFTTVQGRATQPALVSLGIDIDPGHHSDAFDHSFGMATVLVTHPLNGKGAVLVQDCVVKQHIPARRQNELPAHVVPHQAGRNPFAAEVSNASALRERVLANIAESQAAREASRFDIHLARTDQILRGYAADEWGLATLQPGSTVFGGLPGQSAYYTSAATLEASGGSRASLFQSLQVWEHPEFGYRPKVGEYEVVRALTVPAGIVRANPSFGSGLGDQFFIRDYESSLRLIREIPLKQ